MTFLNPSALYALPLVSLPALIHLLARQRAKVVPFSSLRFLRELEHSEIRRLRLREILLLVLRTFAVLLLILAASRPAVVPEGAAPAAGSRTAAFVILDDSYSTEVWTSEGTLFRAASAVVEQIASTLKPGDAGLVVLPRGRQLELRQYPLQPSSAGEETVPPWLSSASHPFDNDLREALHAAKRWVEMHRGFRNELYVVSDFTGRVEFPDTLVRWLRGVAQMYLVPVSRPSVTNLSVQGVRLGSQLLQPGSVLELSVLVVNTGDLPAEDRLLQLYWNGEPVAQKSLTLEPGEAETVTLRVVPQRAGWQRGVVVLEDDALEVDNRLWFALEIPQRLRVLVLSSGDEWRPVAYALSPPGGELGLYEVVVKRPDEASTADVRSADALVLANAGPLGLGIRQELLDRVRGGACLIVLPGPNTDARALSSEILEPLELPAFGGTYGRPGAVAPATTVAWLDREHPVFSGVFVTETPGVSLPLVYFGLRVPRETGIYVIMRCGNGDPFLYEGDAGEGKVFVFTSGLNPGWSDLARRAIFVALMHRLPVYATARVGGRRLYTVVGKRLELLDRRLPLDADYQLLRPDGIRVRLGPRALPGGTYLEYAETDAPGIYQLLVDEQPHSYFAVNPEPQESDLRRADVGRLAAAVGATVLEPGEDLPRKIELLRTGRELWPWLTATLVLLLLVEMAVARTSPERAAGEERAERAKQSTTVSV